MSTIIKHNSHFANTILDMHRFRESLGYSRDTYFSELKDFDCFCTKNHPQEHELTKELALEWGMKRPNESINNHRTRILALRQLGKYINSQGLRAYIIPIDIIEAPERFEPYLFTDDELRTFFHEIDTLPASQQAPFSDYTLPVFFRIAYGCGLRPNELHSLRRYDVNLHERSIFVYNSKAKRDRLISITPDLTELCEKYDRIAEKVYPNRHWFFHVYPEYVNRKDWFQYRLQKYWKSAGLDKRLGKYPRIYDFRHNFATRVLLKWFDDGKDIMTLMPYLSSYMGHVQLHSTLYYVHLLPERLRNCKAFDWSRFESLLPEAHYEEE